MFLTLARVLSDMQPTYPTESSGEEISTGKNPIVRTEESKKLENLSDQEVIDRLHAEIPQATLRLLANFEGIYLDTIGSILRTKEKLALWLEENYRVHRIANREFGL